MNDGQAHTYTYDAENRLTATTATAGYSYVYDGDGKRVKKCSNSGCTSGTLYWTGMGSDPLAESGVGGSNTEEYVFFGGKRIARRDVSNLAVHYYFSDHLSSASVITDNLGSIQKEADYYPFGGESIVSGSDTNNYKFTGKERDAESGLDEFGARYYSSALGRLMIPDWAGKPTAVPYASFGNPQSLNLYSYVNNNPTTTVDPDGHCPDGICQNIATMTPQQVDQQAQNTTDTLVGMIKSGINSVISTINTFALSEAGAVPSGFEIPEMQANNPGQAQGMVIGNAAMTTTAVMGAVELGSDAVAGMRATAAVPDANVVVRGGTAELPPAGTTFSGAHGATLEEAASGVPHGTIRSTTAGAVRESGGTVKSAPELTRSGVMNEKHVNITEGANNPSTFSKPKPNPVPKKDRVQ